MLRVRKKLVLYTYKDQVKYPFSSGLALNDLEVHRCLLRGVWNYTKWFTMGCIKNENFH